MAALRALATLVGEGELDEREKQELAAALQSLASDSKWEVRRELALLLAKPEIELGLAVSLLEGLKSDHTRWVRETAIRSLKQRSLEARRPRGARLTPIPPEPHLAYVAERVAELGSRSIKPHVVLELVARGGEYFYRALAAETAHEVRTLLTPIVGYFEKLVHHLESTGGLDDKSSTYSRTITQRLEQLQVLIDQITIYAGREQMEFLPSDLLEIVRDSVQIAVEKCASEVSVEYDVSEPITAEVNPSRLRQAVVNIATNALEAMQEGGTLTIAGGVTGGEARLTIADTGPGMTAEQVESAFLRFRTTKRARGGTGLGLPIAKRIIEDEHRGTLAMTSVVGAGTVVELSLPIARREQEHGSE